MFAAAAFVPATAAAQVFLGGQPAQFQRLVDMLDDGFLHLVEFLLCIEEAARYWVLEQRIAMLLEV
jgi:hypothetical protein